MHGGWDIDCTAGISMDLYLIRKRVILSQLYSNQFRAILLGIVEWLRLQLLKIYQQYTFAFKKKKYIEISWMHFVKADKQSYSSVVTSISIPL